MWETLISKIINFKNLILVSLILLLSVSLYFEYRYAKQQKEEKNRYSNNYTTLKNGLVYYETKDGKVYGKSGVLELKKTEIDDSIKKQIKNTGLKLKNIKTIIRDSIRIKDTLSLTIKDTLVYDSIKAEYGEYKDKWLSLIYIKPLDSCKAKVTYNVNADIQQNIALIPRGWNIFSKKFWGPRHLEQTITSDNPYIKFPYAKVIEIK